MSFVNSLLRAVCNRRLRRQLKNRDITLIASNCNGGCILHDLGVQFQSPFVDMWIKPKDFLKICEQPEHYMAQELVFVEEEEIDYPVADLGDARIYFQHYKSREEAVERWNERRQRMNYNRLFFLFTDRDGCTYEDLQRFDKLPQLYKVAFTCRPYPEFSSACYIPGFDAEGQVGMCMNFRNKWTWKRYYDAFDYITWFNRMKGE